MELSKCTEKATVHSLKNIGEAVLKPESKPLELAALMTEDREVTVTGEVLYCETLSVAIQDYIAIFFLSRDSLPAVNEKKISLAYETDQ